uniref:hypothetical protein n=1 Tax=Niallia taxi TaxID=2499688 RepID=UPI003F492582
MAKNEQLKMRSKATFFVFSRIFTYKLKMEGSYLNENTQTSQKVELYNKRIITIRTVLNIYGVFAFIGLILSVFTIPVSVSEDMQFFYNKKLLMGQMKIKEFLLFIISAAVAYFVLVNIYDKYTKK